MGKHLRALLLALVTDGSTGSTSGLGVLTSNLKVPEVSETSVHSHLFHSLNVFSELGVQIVGSNLLVLSVLDVLSLVQEPLRESVTFWVSDDFGDLVDLGFGKFTSSLGGVYSCLLAQSDSKSSAKTSDGSDCVWDESLTIDVGIQDTDNVLEVL